MPFENAFEDFIAILLDFVHDKPHQDWLAIERKRDSRGKSPQAVIMAVLNEPQNVQLSLANADANYFQSPLLAVFAAHLYKLKAPELPVHDFIRSLLGTAPMNYGDFEPEDIANLYIKFYNEYEKQADDAQDTNAEIRKYQKAFFMKLAESALRNTPL